MNGIRLLLAAAAGTAFMVSVAFANPGMIPNHAGYPMGATKSPVDGTRTANDPGQSNAVGPSASVSASSTADAASVNAVSDPNRGRITKSGGAGRLPQIEGPLNRVNVNPAGATSTK